MTSIEWLIQVFAHNDIIDHNLLSTMENKYMLYKRLVEQAKEMHKQEIIDALEYGWDNGHIHISILEDVEEKYYNRKFKKD